MILYLTDISKAIKYNRMNRAENVVHTGYIRNAHHIFVIKHNEKANLEDLGIDGRRILICMTRK
jgi:hypothetical protein